MAVNMCNMIVIVRHGYVMRSYSSFMGYNYSPDPKSIANQPNVGKLNACMSNYNRNLYSEMCLFIRTRYYLPLDYLGERSNLTRCGPFNTLRPRQNGRHFPDDILKCIFLNENIWISIKISLKFVPKGPINNIPALVKAMAWRRPGDKPLSETMMVRLPTHICVARPQLTLIPAWIRRKYPVKCGMKLLIHCQASTRPLFIMDATAYFLSCS